MQRMGEVCDERRWIGRRAEREGGWGWVERSGRVCWKAGMVGMVAMGGVWFGFGGGGILLLQYYLYCICDIIFIGVSTICVRTCVSVVNRL